MKERCIHGRAGWSTPQLGIQITPFEWHLGASFFKNKVAIGIGPIAIAVYYRFNPFRKDFYRETK